MTYRAAIWTSSDNSAQLILTFAEDANLSDEELMAKGRIEAAEQGVDLSTGSYEIGQWSE